jgi:hypothetical protein
MCTVSWLHTPGGYQLWCNRDQRHMHEPPLGPMIRNPSGVRVIAPVDGDLGGAWMAVNEAGLAFTLVNRYVCGRCSPGRNRKLPSRGLLLMRLADCRSLEQAQSRFERLDLGSYPPFTIVLLAPHRPSMLLHWTGRDSLIECNGESAMPLISSSFAPGSVEVYRRRLFQTLAATHGCIDAKLLTDFHTSHAPIPSAYSPCMHRDNADTVSFSRVTVANGVIEFAYFPMAPCARRTGPGLDERDPAWKRVRMPLTSLSSPCPGGSCLACRTGMTGRDDWCEVARSAQRGTAVPYACSTQVERLEVGRF